MHRYFGIYRPSNIFFIALAQYLCAYYLDFTASNNILREGGMHWLLLGTAACSAFGYWINDFLDKERDAINKTINFGIINIPNYAVYLHLLLFTCIAVFAGLMLNITFVYIFIATLLLLTMYSLFLKNIAFIGNLVIALLSFVSIFMIALLFPNLDLLLLFHFAALAAVITLSREMVKDGEDADGDGATGAKTVPVVFGKETLNIAVYILLIFTISFSIISLHYQSAYFQGMLRYLYYSYYLLFVLIPLYQIAVHIRYAKHKSEYTKLSLWLKYVLATGILSILFF